MLKSKIDKPADLNPAETQEWLEALEQVIEDGGPERARYLLERLAASASKQDCVMPSRWQAGAPGA